MGLMFAAKRCSECGRMISTKLDEHYVWRFVEHDGAVLGLACPGSGEDINKGRNVEQHDR